MSSMTTDETYNGWKNRETWAFNLHWQNDQGMYVTTLETARDFLAGNEYDDPQARDVDLGTRVVEFWREFIDEYSEGFDGELGRALAMFRDEVGSWWRIDYAEVGAAVRESLDAES